MKLSSKTLGIFILILSMLLGIKSGMAQPRANGAICFYNSETSINNFASVKAMFDNYLSQFGDFKFQPFNQKSVFEEIIKITASPTVLVLSSWHYSSLSKTFPLSPVLIATRKGKCTFKKSLLAIKPISGVNDLRGKIVASSGSVEYTQNILKEMFGQDKESLLASITILHVPKDMDALMSVGFGVAHGALTSESNLQQMEAINPNLKEQMNILCVSEDILMPIAAIEKGMESGESTLELIEIMKKMNSTDSGREKLSILSLDGWEDISPEMKKRLEP